MKRQMTCVLIASMLGLASLAQAAVLTDIQSFSDAGGIWNNDSTPNWAIWIAPGSNPNATPYPFLNDAGGPVLPTTPVTIPIGTTTYVLYKANYGSVDVSDNFIFGSSVLTISPNLAYIATSATPATGAAGPITVGGEQVSISGFGWYAPGAYNANFVSQGQNPSPDSHGPNDVALVTFTVTPEPASLGLFGLAGLGMLARKRRA